MNWHRVLLVSGIAAVTLGILALVAPEAITADINQAAVTLVGVLALLQVVRVAYARSQRDTQQAQTGTPERRQSVSPPGETLDDAFGYFRVKPHTHYRFGVRDGLADAAVSVLTRYTDCTEKTAREHVENGTWTDDPLVGRFLAGDGDVRTYTPTSFRALLRRNSPTDQVVSRCVDAIAAVAENGHQHSGERSREELETDTAENRDNDTAENRDEHRNPDEYEREERGGEGLHARRQTGRWDGISVVALLAVGVGVLVEQPGVLLVGVVGIVYAAYTRANPPSERPLSVERAVSDERPDPGDSVEVTVTVTNESGRVLPDIRLVDGVPGPLSVTNGSPRLGTALRPGERAEFSYTVQARRGVHEFTPLLALVRTLPGTVEDEWSIATPSPSALTCVPRLDPLPVSLALRQTTTQYAGVEETASAGDGAEFYATRLYQPGDSMSRIDWNRQARTGEFSTLLFREERLLRVVLVIDAGTFVAPEPNTEHTLDRSVDAAGQLYATLQSAGHSVGVATLQSAACWLPPGTGATHREKTRELLARHPVLQSTPYEPDESPVRAKRILRSRLSPETQLLVFSPLCRPSVVRTIRQFEAAGYPVTVVSPDPTAANTPSQRLARIGRRVHVTDIRRDGIPVIDWGWDESLPGAVARFSSTGVSP